MVALFVNIYDILVTLRSLVLVVSHYFIVVPSNNTKILSGHYVEHIYLEKPSSCMLQGSGGSMS